MPTVASTRVQLRAGIVTVREGLHRGAAGSEAAGPVGLQLGGLKVDTPVILAPMAGITDRPMRDLAVRFGAGWVVSEMV